MTERQTRWRYEWLPGLGMFRGTCPNGHEAVAAQRKHHDEACTTCRMLQGGAGPLYVGLTMHRMSSFKVPTVDGEAALSDEAIPGLKGVLLVFDNPHQAEEFGDGEYMVIGPRPDSTEKGGDAE